MQTEHTILEDDDYYPVVMKVKAENGTPVAHTREILGNDGMKGFEKETTIGRNTEWEYGDIRNVGTEDDPRYEVDITVRPKVKGPIREPAHE